MRLKDFNETFDYELREPQYAAGYLAWSAEEDGQDGFLSALRDVVRANGGMANLALQTGLNRENLFKAVSRTGDPKLSTVLAVLQSLGLQISITPIGAHDKAMAERYAAGEFETDKEIAAVG